MSAYSLDKDNAKMMGVCSGLARATDMDVTVVRILAVVATLLVTGLTIPLYIAAGLIAPTR